MFRVFKITNAYIISETVTQSFILNFGLKLSPGCLKIVNTNGFHLCIIHWDYLRVVQISLCYKIANKNGMAMVKYLITTQALPLHRTGGQPEILGDNIDQEKQFSNTYRHYAHTLTLSYIGFSNHYRNKQ